MLLGLWMASASTGCSSAEDTKSDAGRDAAKSTEGGSTVKPDAAPDTAPSEDAAPDTNQAADAPPMADSGADVAACEVSGACTPADPCHVGERMCEAAGEACMDTGKPQANGTQCGTDKVCGDGVCVDCPQGASCTVTGKPCKLGTIECGLGTPVCVEAGNADNGKSCASGKVCSSGACVACADGASCVPTNPCHKGSLTCAGGNAACTDAGTALADGSACGTNKVCSLGQCVACEAGKACAVAGNPCRSGATSCNTGKAVCVDTGNAPNGQLCDTGKVCSAGACVACTPGTACTPANPCHAGALACQSGTPTCNDNGTSLANGTSCGSGQVCNGGKCASCVAGNYCVPSKPCSVGVTSCASGTSACNVVAQAPDGAPCGDNLVCSAGTCIPCAAGSCIPKENPCHVGTLDCAGGAAVCVDKGANLRADGVACGTNLVCFEGSCTPCKAGVICTPGGNVCQIGATSCLTGQSVCNFKSNVPDGTSCGENMTCIDGTCVGCIPGAKCTPANACRPGTIACPNGVPTCVEGERSLPDGTACGTNLVCSEGNCVPCTSGVDCRPKGGACKTGKTSCGEGGLVCLETGDVANGTSCGEGLVCNQGNCVGCGAGAGCTPENVCHVGVISCATGTEVCTDTQKPVKDGTSCGSIQAALVQAEQPPGVLVCLKGSCVSCPEGASCLPDGNVCKTGINSCATGTPVCQETGNVPNGQSCGEAMVCSAGKCEACQEGLLCTPENPCHVGLVSCKSGSAVCVDTQKPVGDGTSCGANLVCAQGTCVTVKPDAGADTAEPDAAGPDTSIQAQPNVQGLQGL